MRMNLSHDKNSTNCASCVIPVRECARMVTKGKRSKEFPTVGRKKLVTAVRKHLLKISVLSANIVAQLINQEVLMGDS